MQHIAAHQLPAELARPLWRFVLRRRQVAILRAAAVATMLAMLWVLAWGVVDRFVPLSSLTRLALLLGLVLLVARVLRSPVKAVLRGEIDWRSAARQFEERDGRFAQALVTVVSETLAPTSVRGSAQITAHLASQVEATFRTGHARSTVEARPALRAWGLAAGAALLFTGLAFWPWLDLHRLLRRQFAPLSGIAPVTRSRIVVQPGTVEVLHGAEATLIAQVQNPGSEGVIVRTTTDGKNWNSTGMTLNPDGTYTRTLTSLSRDAQYEVRTGDAVSGPYSIRVLHHPIVRDLRVRLEYPSYVDREPLTVNVGEGPIEVPTGTLARVVVVASEPLRSAWFTVNGIRTETQPLTDIRARQIDLTITHDTQIGIQMVSERGVSGSGPEGLVIRSIPDGRPFARLMVPTGFILLGPRSSTQLPYEVIDDYAVASVRGRIEVDGVTRGEMPLSPTGEPHRQEGTLQLNLADWNVEVGQIVAVSLVATDRANWTSVSAPTWVLVSPETVLPEHRRRIAELKEAARLASGITAELESARNGLDAAAEPVADHRHATARLALAAERSIRLMRSLLLAGSGINSPPQARLYAGLIDVAQVQALSIEEANAQSSVEPFATLRQRIMDLSAASIPLERAIQTLWQGHSADVILAERRALTTGVDRAMPELDRLREAIETETQQLGLEPRLPDVDLLLQARVESARRVVETFPVADLSTVAGEWARRADPRSLFLPERLNAAAQAEAVRADADLIRTRDLQLAARAARAMEASTPPSSPDRISPREGLPVFLNALAQEHELRRTGAVVDPSPMGANAALAARQLIAGWAGESTIARADYPVAQPQTQSSPGRPAQGVAPVVSETRDQALVFIRRTENQLAELPQLLADVEQAAQSVRAARSRLRDAMREAETAPADEQAAARRAVAAAEETVNDNLELLVEAAQTIDFNQPESLAAQLRRYIPDTAPAVASIEGPFAAALAALYRAITEQNPDNVERSIAETYRAIATVQQTLRDSRATLLARDPTFIARAFAGTTRPATQAAMGLDVMRRPWDDPIRRLIEPQLTPQSRRGGINFDDQIATTRPANSALPANPVVLPRQWQIDDLSEIRRENDPLQYRDALNIYFQVLGASDSEGP